MCQGASVTVRHIVCPWNEWEPCY